MSAETALRPVAAGDRLRPIDGMRGIAIALVVWYHVWELTWQRADITLFGRTFNFNWICETGFLGVDLFFFISGFCLFYPYAHALFDHRPKQTLAQFAFRRAIKILPSYWLAIAAFVIFGIADFPGQTLVDDVKQVVLHLLFVHTWFDDAYGSINGVLWSLGVEVEFYIVFPLICALVMRRAWAGFALMLLAGVASRARLFLFDQSGYTHGISQLPAVVDEFGAGMLAAYLFRAIATRAPALAKQKAIWTGVALAGVALACVLMQQLFAARVLDNWAANWYVFNRSNFEFALLLIALGSLFGYRAWQVALGNPLFVYLSLISYNLYLWHAAIAHLLLDRHFPPYSAAVARQDHGWTVPFTVLAWALSIALASLITFVYERPILRWRPKREPRLRVSPNTREPQSSL